MDNTVLVINCGSSSIKFCLFQGSNENPILSGLAERLGSDTATLNWEYGNKNTLAIPEGDHGSALEAIIKLIQQNDSLPNVDFVGHRVVHGGESFTASVQITDTVIEAIEHCIPLAPLHNPANLLGIKSVQKLFPELPQVAVFDTAFHQSMPAEAFTYPIPYELYSKHRIRRYGFHGTSHRYVALKAAQILNSPNNSINLVTAHLGNGCSTCAILNGKSVDTSMGLTPLEGVVMGTRSGDVDPTLMAYLLENLDYSVDKTVNMLNKESGLLGLSGISNDMRTLLEAAEQGNERASLAIEVFCHRLAKSIASMITSLPSLDALVFTGGIGEHAAKIRQKVLSKLAVFGFTADTDKNEKHGKQSNGEIQGDNAKTVLVIPTNEELMIAQDTQEILTKR